MAASLAGIQKLHVAVLVEAELQSLRGIVHLGGNDGVGKLDVIGKLLINIEQRGSLWETLRHIVVLAAYL